MIIVFIFLYSRAQLVKEKQAREEAERKAKENAAKLKAFEEEAARARKGMIVISSGDGLIICDQDH